MNECGAYVGLDVHKDTIAVAVALPGRDEPVYRGEIKSQRKSVLRLIRSLSPHGEVLSFCYEAGPCGYGVYREIIETGHQCEVVAPSLIPRRAGERVKTDRRDAVKLAWLHRSGELTAVWVPDEEQEAIRDLTRAREDMKAIELKARQRLGAFLLRHGRVYREGKSRWTQKHFRWLEEQKFEHPVQQVVLQEYIDTVVEARTRVASLEEQMRQALEGWSLRPVVEALIALRGVDLITAMTVLAELGDLTRFDSPRELMAFWGWCRASIPRAGAGARGDYQDGQRACAPGAGRVGVELSVPCPQDQALAIQGASGAAGSPGHGLGGTEAPVYAVSASVSRRQEDVRGHHRGGPRAGGVHLGHRLRGEGPTPCDAGAELSDGPQFSTPCPPPRQCSRHAAPWTRRGQLRRRAPGRRGTMRS